MERKRKLPARASARVEHVAKKRTVTPPEPRSVTPVPVPVEEPPPPPSLPKSIQPGKPLPTVEDPQPDDLTAREYQSFQESGVLAESLSRSRHKWMAEGLFEKYWTKPARKKNATEDPKNPSKDTMSKIGQVTITIEPHVFEATMWAIKDLKPPTPTTQATFRPILQYGPPNGVMPPPPTPVSTNPGPSSVVNDSKSTPPAPSPAPPSPAPQPLNTRPPSATTNDTPKAILSPRTHDPLQPASATPPPPRPVAPSLQAAAAAAPHAPAPVVAPGTPSYPGVPPAAAPSAPNSRPSSSTPQPGAGAVKPAPAGKPQGTDPIIMTLAEKASEDPHLRDLMKRVAAGEAKPDELSNFQKIIDQITAEYKRKGGQQGPSADRLLVDGRTVKYFADEVRTILDIVLATNPRQKSSELLPPRGSDPLVVALVRAALDDAKVRAMIRRIADNQPGFTDATDLKAALDKLHKDLRGTQTTPQPQTPTPQASINGVPNGQVAKSAAAAPAASPAPNAAPVSGQQQQHPPQQALRSKGPPPPTRPDISGVCLDFTGGNGDRYLFPKYSILEYLPGGQQVVASFLIVRKGSQLEYGGDAKLDYYQPVTIRIYAHSGRHLEYLQRVVAPPDEVRRYMDDVMDNMTRAEYVLLAMRLPRGEREPDSEQHDKETVGAGNQTSRPESSAPEHPAPKQQSVLWGPITSRFVRRFNKQWFEEWKRSEKANDKRARDIFQEACEAVGRDPLDKDIEYEKMIELLAAKDAESSS
ncbi:hypothetical protein CH063_09599 [Colletotrichum higginsianum]|uniref:SWR1-complex protein 3 domain-containing protein n=1 Tax=Colletotrichum higginsianum (strain IMI 349063) TaxID=759273 RepID=H1VE87_COLHI|nr:hypothetical protein CH63R_06198 [Colletotrichum higginsianum IMI 349063]OBR10506.1 hypothetical protein CH63R_06198 [Colletotrichum higginsianum IMI 349063]CCF38540.1 hypothetical protein CH063_09599 [Colletotrichum higginsianum]